jgi:hypothetical protein
LDGSPVPKIEDGYFFDAKPRFFDGLGTGRVALRGLRATEMALSRNGRTAAELRLRAAQNETTLRNATG